MKKAGKKLFGFFLTLFILGNIAAQNLQGQNLQGQNLPLATGLFVNDFVGVMKNADKEEAERLGQAIRDKTGAELVIVIIESYYPYAAIDAYSVDLAQTWGIGEKGKDTGVLLILAMTEREVRIEVGYGFEGAIPDSLAGRIIDTAIIPLFREGDFSGGLLAGYKTIAGVVVKEMSVEGFDLPDVEELSGFSMSIVIIVIFVVFLIVLILINLIFRLLGLFGIGRRFLSSSGRSFLGGRSSFGGGGGGGRSSFGGGSFGGGGASRKF